MYLEKTALRYGRALPAKLENMHGLRCREDSNDGAFVGCGS